MKLVMEFAVIDLQIMVRTKRLGRALGHVTGGGDRDDSNDAPQCQRPTASAHRQRVAVTAEHDEPVVPATQVEGVAVQDDLYADEPMAGGDVQDTRPGITTDTGTQTAEDEPEGFLGGPSDPSVLTEYADHVTGSVCTGEVFIILNLS